MRLWNSGRMLIVALILTLVIPVGTKARAADIPQTGDEEEVVMADTTVYPFVAGDASSDPAATLEGDPAAEPAVRAAGTGLAIDSTAAAPARTFRFEVPSAGRYRIELGGMTAADGGTAEISIDGTTYGEYSFYSINGQYPKPDLYVEQLDLSAGEHTVTLSVKSPGNGVGNGTGTKMYPVRLLLTDLSAVASSKTRSTYYTPAKQEAARQNVQQFDWAASQRDSAVSSANAYLAMGYEGLWDLVPTQNIPRSYNTNQLLGNFSPVSGDLKSYGNYPWQADPLNDPWKIVDPASGYKFPTNDFQAYYKSGLDAHGDFQPDLADKSLLVNTLYPEKGPTWGVDDGYGWVDPATGKRYTFVAYYAHWFLWYGGTAAINNAVSALQNAYVYTGDAQYARAGAVLLSRIADVYPSLDVAAFDKGLYVNSHGGTGDGKAVGSIWETSLVKSFVTAYDAFFPVFDDPEVITFLQSKGEQFDLPLKNNGTELRRGIEDGILRQVYPGVKWDQIRGNNGFHQSALAMAAVVLDTMPETRTWLDYVFRPGGFVNSIPRQVTGGNVLYSMVNDVDRDGNGNEAAPGYNRLWLGTFMQAADILAGYDKYPAADLYQNVKFRKMFQGIYPLVMLGSYTPSIGDSGTTGQPGVLVDKAQSIKAFEQFGTPVYAQLAYMLNGNKTDGIHSDIFTPDPEKVSRDIESVIQSEGPLDLKSVNLTGYGFAGLRDGEQTDDGDNRRSAWMYYGRSQGHGHLDSLNIGLYGFGLDLAPDLGYPEQANATDVNRFEWVQNTISHNTVVVDDSKQQPQYGGTPVHYDDSPMVQMVDVESPKAYPQTELYRRTTAMVKVDEENSYAIDFFRVKGGSDHRFSFHAAEGPVTTEGLNLTPQETGSYAGPDVEYGVRPADDSVSGSGYAGPGYHWLKNVRRDNDPSSQFSVDWHITDTWKVLQNPEDIHVRMTMVGENDDIALADGVPPQNKPGNPKSLTYLLAHRSGQDLSSTFVSVIEPYKDQRFVRGISAVPVTAADTGEEAGDDVRAVKVELQDGRVDYIVSALNPDAAYTVDGNVRFQGSFGIYSEKEGLPVFTYMNDGAYIGKIGPASFASSGVARLSGTVADFTKDLSLDNTLTVQMDLQGEDPNRLIGKTVYVRNDGVRNAAYLIRGVTQTGEGIYELDLGDATLIRAYADNADITKGFVYDVAAGDAFAIPLSRTRYWLSDVKIAVPKTELKKNESVPVEVQGYYADGTRADLSGVQIKYDIDHENIANVDEQNRLKAHNPGTAVIATTVELDGVRRQGSVRVTVSE
ncbi:heparinase II/III domain-containing protein [Cohnella zeiphila]|uniref:Heparinase II/III family protein n=1 Tax=Cohnella zeiphila TaxID=2761120 RepID=A0A7X0ST11_9BACL|nr:heparinase II/III family protein [Cohnella zeiphila]MBB6735589.1 heparinase II/III family protein [Cohnella zeiphila]